jgi:hypothetical protein
MIEVTHDGTGPGDPAERCCFCRAATRYWYRPKDVAVCTKCAPHADDADVPAKRIWCRRERIAMLACGEIRA